MKTLCAGILVSLSIGLLNSAVAEPFNDRGEDWLRKVSPSTHTTARSEEYSITSSPGFNDRGENWVETVSPSRNYIKGQRDWPVVTSLTGFNDKSHVEITTAPPMTFK